MNNGGRGRGRRMGSWVGEGLENDDFKQGKFEPYENYQQIGQKMLPLFRNLSKMSFITNHIVI